MKMKEKLAVMRFFLKENTKGGVTVFICLILIPVLMFTGLMIDFARIKLYHAEAASVSANYADAVLSQYDEMLYNVYGLLAVTQDEEAIKALDVIREYMASAYDPSTTGKVTNASKSDLKHLPNNVVFIGMNNAALDSLWSPYGNTKMVLSSVADKKSGRDNSLANKYVFADQVCDYMKIIGPVDLAWNGILSAVEGNEQAKQKKELMNQRKKVDDNYNKLDDRLKELYNKICDVNKFDEWEIPDEIISNVDKYIYNYNDVFYSRFAELVGGKYEGNYNIDISDSIFGSLFEALGEEVKKENKGQYEAWKTEIDNIPLNSDPETYSYNPLYMIKCYREVLATENLENLVKNKYGDLDNWGGTKYALTLFAKQFETMTNNELNEIGKKLKEDSNVKKSLNDIKNLLQGKTHNILGIEVKETGINQNARNAEEEREKLLTMCDNMSNNDMAEGMKDEYSFEAKNYNDEDKTDLEAIDNGNIKFVGKFDYSYLQQKYMGSINYIAALNNFLESDKAIMNEQISNMKELSSELVKYIDLQLENVENGTFSSWDFQKYMREQNKMYRCGFYMYLQMTDKDLIFKDRDSVEKAFEALNTDCKWFNITDGKANKIPENQDYSTLWEVLVKWYGEGGSSNKKDAKTKIYKDLLAKIKEIVGKGDAGQSLIDSFDGVSIPDGITCEALSNSEALEQSISSLFGDDGNFNGNADTQKSPRDGSYYLTKLLMMDYDWNFFANATFDKHPEKDKDKKENPADAFQGKTLKGEKITDKTNYLVNTVTPKGETSFLGGAELEFIYWGNRDAQSNLKAVRTQITVIRAVENFASTYSIKEINNAISAIRNALAAIPIAALIVPPLIRAAIAMAETYMDLKALYEGKSIALYKSKLEHLTLLQNADLKKLVEDMFTSEGNSSPLSQKSSSSDDDETIMFNYSQFVILCTMLFCDTDTIVERTQTLVELNMNLRLSNKDTVKNAKTADDLKFRLSDAKVTVTSVCTIDKMNLLVLGGIFKDETVEDYLSGDKTEILKNGFSYTVSRSY